MYMYMFVLSRYDMSKMPPCHFYAAFGTCSNPEVSFTLACHWYCVGHIHIIEYDMGLGLGLGWCWTWISSWSSCYVMMWMMISVHFYMSIKMKNKKIVHGMVVVCLLDYGVLCGCHVDVMQSCMSFVISCCRGMSWCHLIMSCHVMM